VTKKLVWVSLVVVLMIALILVRATTHGTRYSALNLRSIQGNPQTTNSNCITPAQAKKKAGTATCVQFTGYADKSGKGQMYLDQQTSYPYGFSVYVPAGSSFGPALLSSYSAKLIDVTGTITQYDGEPEIEVTSPAQIRLPH
jgi:hypothetical protein